MLKKHTKMAASLIRGGISKMNIASIHLGKNQRGTIREALKAGTLKAALIPIGATEQHNEQLAMEHDIASCLIIASRVAEELYPSLVVTPPVPVGSSPHHLMHPGTLSLKVETLVMVLRDMVESLAQHGLRKFIILNGHGSNVRGLKDHLEEIKNGQDIELLFCSHWHFAEADFVEKTFGYPANFPGHAGEFETSLALALFPENVDLQASYPTDLNIPDAAMKTRDAKLFQEAKAASSAEKGKAYLEHILPKITEELKRFIAA